LVRLRSALELGDVERSVEAEGAGVPDYWCLTNRYKNQLSFAVARVGPIWGKLAAVTSIALWSFIVVWGS
jgi:hypothetical protein